MTTPPEVSFAQAEAHISSAALLVSALSAGKLGAHTDTFAIALVCQMLGCYHAGTRVIFHASSQRNVWREGTYK